jgi:outer membrane lipoprotein-sorting protein
MKRTIIILLAIIPLSSFGQPSADEIIDRVDRNMSADNQVVESQMIIHGRRASRTITSVSYTVGDEKSFTEYLSPPREEGTKMLKLEDQLWIYSPSTDRTIQISGHMLRQSVMGSDLSYEDLMNDRKLTDVYSAQVTGSEEIDGRDTWVLQLEATVSDIAYASRRVWIDKEKYVPLKEELYAKSGQLLKRSSMSDIQQVDGRWYPMTIVYKDVLKQGDGTEFKVIDIKFNQDIPDYMFSKAALKQ